MSKIILISGKSNRSVKAKECGTFISKFLGLMFRSSILEDEGILLFENQETKINSAIHMFFMNFAIAVFWINQHHQVVDKAVAKPWRPFYNSRFPAMYILETHVSQIDLFELGEQLNFKND